MGLEYRGRAPDSDFSVVHKKWADDHYTLIKVDTAYVNTQVATAVVNLADPAFVDAQDNLRAKTALVDAADALYVPLTQKGQPNGVASIGSDGYVIPSQLPALTTERKPVSKNVDTIYLSGTRGVTNLTPKEFKAATLTFADPGFPYIPLVIASVQGGATSGTQGPKTIGGGSYGQISVLDADDKRYAWAVCTDQKSLSYHLAIPYGEPLRAVPYSVSGALTLDLWLGLWSGSAYTFTSDNLVFYLVAYPSM